MNCDILCTNSVCMVFGKVDVWIVGIFCYIAGHRSDDRPTVRLGAKSECYVKSMQRLDTHPFLLPPSI